MNLMLRTKRRVPPELERMILLLVPRSTAHKCLTLAKGIHVWLEPHLYRMVCLMSDNRAKKFLQSMLSRPEFALSIVEALCLNVSVRLETATAILTLCSRIKYLNMRFPCHLLGKNPILELLAKLSRLAVLHLDLSSVFNTRVIYLPDISVFRSVTHLHVSNAWASWSPAAKSIGLEHLTQITHLSFYLSTVRTHPVLLKGLLKRSNLAVLVLWKRSYVPVSAAKQFLEDSDLQDDRVVMLDEQLFRYHTLDDGFWACAERAIKRRQEKKTTFSSCDDDIVVPYVLQHADGFHSEIGWMIQTDVESNDSSDSSSASGETSE